MGGRLLSHSVGIPNLIGIGGKLKKFCLQFFPKNRWAGWPGGLASHWQSPPHTESQELFHSSADLDQIRRTCPSETWAGAHQFRDQSENFELFASRDRGTRGSRGRARREAPCRPPTAGLAKGKAESKKFFHVSASLHQICHPRHWCPMATVQQFWGEPNKFSAPYTGMFSEMLLRVVKWPNRMQTRCSVSDTVQTRWSIVVDHYHGAWQVSSESIEK